MHFPVRFSATLALGLCACTPHPLKGIGVDVSSEDTDPVPVYDNRNVDILFVIDNSWSMGEEQGNLAANFSKFIDVLERDDVRADYRIAVTTTDNGHQSCNTKPGIGGLMRMTSCLDREQEFIDAARTISRFNTACQERCKFTDKELQLAPTEVDGQSERKPRPWIQSVGGKTNLPEGISAQDAFACFGPQGIDGCGFEAQLESMYRALYLSTEPTSESFGFMRPDAMLAVVFVTDESDCSYNARAKDSDEAFDGTHRELWGPYAGSQPTSAVCWNAGVSCSDEQGGYFETCEPAQHASDGERLAVDDSENSVLHPIARYEKLLKTLEEQKRNLNPARDEPIIVALIAGVDREGRASYPADEDDYFQQYGIGAGCVGSVQVLEEVDPLNSDIKVPPHAVEAEATPPVRLKAIAERFAGEGSPRTMFSVCDPDYAPALERIAEIITRQFTPACLDGCILDAKTGVTSLLEPKCQISRTVAGKDVPIAECEHDYEEENGQPVKVYATDDKGDYVMPSENDDSCYVLRVDDGLARGGKALSKSTADDLDPECVEAGSNVELYVARRPGVPSKPGETILASCELSTNASVDCAPDGG